MYNDPVREVRMNKILLALFVCVISVNAFACGGDKNEEEKKRFETVTTVQH